MNPFVRSPMYTLHNNNNNLTLALIWSQREKTLEYLDYKFNRLDAAIFHSCCTTIFMNWFARLSIPQERGRIGFKEEGRALKDVALLCSQLDLPWLEPCTEPCTELDSPWLEWQNPLRFLHPASNWPMSQLLTEQQVHTTGCSIYGEEVLCTTNTISSNIKCYYC